MDVLLQPTWDPRALQYSRLKQLLEERLAMGYALGRISEFRMSAALGTLHFAVCRRVPSRKHT